MVSGPERRCVAQSRAEGTGSRRRTRRFSRACRRHRPRRPLKEPMLNAVIRFSLRYRMLVVVISLALLVYGSYLATQMPIDVFPDLDRPRVVIITECPGLATEEVETLVTQPIEIAILGAAGVQAVRSQTTAGLNVIYVEFTWTTEVRAAR